MNKMHSEYVKSGTSGWLRILGTFCGVFTVLFFLFYIVWVIYNGKFVTQISRCVFLFIIILFIIWSYSKTLYYTVTATDRGLETDNIVGTNKLFLWEEIIEVRRPRFGFPVNFTYVISKSEDKIILIRNRKNYIELIQSIKEKATNLKKCNP
jgi:hypothetical protein